MSRTLEQVLQEIDNLEATGQITPSQAASFRQEAQRQAGARPPQSAAGLETGIGGAVGGVVANEIKDRGVDFVADLFAEEAVGSVAGPAVSTALPGAAALPPAAAAGAQGAATVAGAGSSAAGATPAVAAGGPLATAAGVAAGAAVGQQQLSGAQKIIEGEDPSLIEHAALFPLTGGFSLLTKAGDALGIGGGKGRAQQERDAVRGRLQDIGISSENHTIQLADGSQYDIGKDGGSTFTSFDGTQQVHNGFEVDWTNPLSDQAAGSMVPFFKIVTGNAEIGEDAIAGLINGVMSNANGDQATLEANARKLYTDAGLTPQRAFAEINMMHAQGLISTDEARAYQNAVNEIFDTEVVSPTSGEFSLQAIEQKAAQSDTGLVNDIFSGGGAPQAQSQAAAGAEPGEGFDDALEQI